MPALEKTPVNDSKGGLTGPWLETFDRLLTARWSRTSLKITGSGRYGSSGLEAVFEQEDTID